jgi:hypothetical protein
LSTKETLIAARALIADPAHWTGLVWLDKERWRGGALAEDELKREVKPLDTNATRFSVEGALCRTANGFSAIDPEDCDLVIPNPLYYAAFDNLNEAADMLFGVTIVKLAGGLVKPFYTDTDCHKAVLACFDYAINGVTD